MYRADIQMFVRGFSLNEADLEISWPLQLFDPYTRTRECACVDHQAFMSKSFLTQINISPPVPNDSSLSPVPWRSLAWKSRDLYKKEEVSLKHGLNCKIF